MRYNVTVVLVLYCHFFKFFFSNRDALNLLKKAPVPEAAPTMEIPAAPLPVPTPAAAPPPPGSRPNIPPLSVPGKPGTPVSISPVITLFCTSCFYHSICCCTKAQIVKTSTIKPLAHAFVVQAVAVIVLYF